MVKFPIEFVIDLQKIDQPYKVDVYIEKLGVMANFPGDKPPIPEPTVRLILTNTTTNSVVYLTNTSAVPLLGDMTETMVMSILAYHVIFSTLQDIVVNSRENRLEALQFCEAYAAERVKSDRVGPLPVRNNKQPALMSRELIDLANIKLNQYYHIGKFDYRGHTVWLKRRLYHTTTDKWSYGLESRWSFSATGEYLSTTTASKIDYENKHVFSLHEGMGGPLLTFEEVCREFDASLPPVKQ